MPAPEGMHSPEACYGSPWHCFWHHADEPHGWLRCFECGHAYARQGDLLAAYNAVLGISETDEDKIFCCAFCAHDF